MNIFLRSRSGFERVRTPNRTCLNLNLAFGFEVQKITEPERKFSAARERMAVRREKIKTDAGLHKEALQRAREASRRYREQNARELAFKQRQKRDIADIKKYGEEELASRNRTRQERRETARAAAELRTWGRPGVMSGRRRPRRRAQRDAAETLTALQRAALA
ncbi:hypothetical protein GGX14DRAFT_391913 [Mycena pura]|uniref:Uncharacterized protein n=1 Tax=Mycena pura TaxID=153505 RepID=A0AAD6VKB8_9AGAR|nr:hypothetical protein GGX14DRAFT_391913 [Mycena pura]